MHKVCVIDGREFEAKRAAAKYCSERCRKRAQRKPGARAGAAVVSLVAPSSEPAGDGDLTAATRRRLTEADREQTEMGAAALMLASRLDRVGAVETGAGVAALMREWRATLAEAVKNAEHDDALERIRNSAALKLIAGGRA